MNRDRTGLAPLTPDRYATAVARSRTSRSLASARFVARVYCISINRYVDMPEEAGPFVGTYVPVWASCNGVEFRGTLAPRGGGRYRLGLNAWTKATMWS